MEEVFKISAEYVSLALEASSILIVACGGLEAAYRALWPLLSGRASHELLHIAWLSMARWLILGLEFMLAADIVRTAISPDWEAIGQLGAIAVIRTFLNYFLERDLRNAGHAPDAPPRPLDAP